VYYAFVNNSKYLKSAALASHKGKATELDIDIWFLHFIKGVKINLSIDDGEG
jgi:hypothetical protein